MLILLVVIAFPIAGQVLLLLLLLQDEDSLGRTLIGCTATRIRTGRERAALYPLAAPGPELIRDSTNCNYSTQIYPGAHEATRRINYEGNRALLQETLNGAAVVR